MNTSGPPEAVHDLVARDEFPSTVHQEHEQTHRPAFDLEYPATARLNFTIVNLVGHPRRVGPNALWFDTSVFSAPAAGTWGNVHRNSVLTGPGYVNLDASIVKSPRVS